MLKYSSLALAFMLACSIPSSLVPDRGESFFDKSFAVVVGIDHYSDPKRQTLAYAVKDGRAFAELLKAQGFEVTELYDEAATREQILQTLETWLVSKPSKDDRVLVFFAGHGDRRGGAGGERGYLVPFDAGGASPITYVELRELSGASAARHQLFVIDACFAGLAAAQRGSMPVDRSTPEYLFNISARPARQLLAAGGAKERVLDAGPNGHSYFMGYVLKALKEGVADFNADGILTTTELFGYVQVAASTYTQTPLLSFFAGHEGGDFWFVNPVSARITQRANASPVTDAYGALNEGKVALQAEDYSKARADFERAATLGNADAMNYLGKLLWEGLGGVQDKRAALDCLEVAANLGHVGAMQNLGIAYQLEGEERNLEASRRWFAAFDAAQRIDSRISPSESRIARPEAPAIPR